MIPKHTNKKINCAVVICTDKNKYLMCTSEDFDDMLEKVSMWCGPAEQLVQNIDIIEFEAQKGRTEIRRRENDTEILA